MTVHLIPGIGGTADMFRDYHFPFAVNKLEYLPPRSWEETFAQYARRFASTRGIAPGDGIVGMSLGGLLGCEISKFISLSRLVLISSGTQARHISSLLRSTSPLSRHVPFEFLQAATRPTNLFGATRRRTLEMFKASNAEFLRWGCWQAAHWSGLDKARSETPITQIHGTWDLVFPYFRQRQEIDHVIPRAGHITLLRQPHLINPWLLELLVN